MSTELTTRRKDAQVPKGLEGEWERLSAMTDDQLKSEMGVILETTAKNLLRLALVIRQLEERGHDLSSLKVGMLGYLRKIAYGQLLPEVLSQFGAYPGLLRRISNLPLPDQRKCLKPEGVKVGSLNGEKVDSIFIDPTRLTRGQIQQVFAADHLREPEEQVAWLRGQTFTGRRLPAPIEVDKRHGAIVVTGEGVRITKEELLMYLARLG